MGTKQSHTLEVPVEERIAEIQARYMPCNFHAKSYTWKRLGKPLDMNKTLEENGVKDESEEFEKLGIDPDDHIPALHLYFNDDLTEALMLVLVFSKWSAGMAACVGYVHAARCIAVIQHLCYACTLFCLYFCLTPSCIVSIC